MWPENDAFGASDADAEDEFMALREILFANIPKPQYLRTDEVMYKLDMEPNILLCGSLRCLSNVSSILARTRGRN